MKEQIIESIQKGIAALEQMLEAHSLDFIETVAKTIANCYKNEGKILIAGNGGSLCDAMHFAEELTGFFREKRPALPAIALADPGHMSCVGNDVGFDEIFSRGVEAHGKEGDIFIALTTSGNSINLLRAVEMAKEKKMETVAFLGKTGGALKGLCDYEWIVKGFKYSDRIQEAHMTAIHIIIEIIEKELFSVCKLKASSSI